MNLYQQLQERAQHTAERIAIIDEKRSKHYSYAQLIHDVDSFSTQLHDLGIKEGERVLILTPMSYKLYVALIALFRLGACAVFVDPSQSSDFVNHACSIARPKAMIATPKALLLKLKFKAIRDIPTTILSSYLPFHTTLSTHYPINQTLTVPHPKDALMSFTSGSTGRPKAIVRSHHFLSAQYKVLKPHIHLREGETDLCALPIFLLANLLAGVSSIIADLPLAHPKKIPPQKLLESMINNKATRIGASPALFEQLSQVAPEKSLELDAFYMGGAPVLPALLHKLHQGYPKTRLHVLYGSSEAEPIASYEYADLSTKIEEKMRQGEGLYVGRVIEEIALKIHDGEILVTGDHVVQSYYRGIGDEENKIEIDGKIWHKSGDMGYLDRDGHLWLLGRKSALIIKDGVKIHPFSIEVAMREMTHEMAALVEHDGKVLLLSESEQLDFHFQGVDEIIHIDKIPLDRRHNAKVDYVALKRSLHSL